VKLTSTSSVAVVAAVTLVAGCGGSTQTQATGSTHATSPSTPPVVAPSGAATTAPPTPQARPSPQITHGTAPAAAVAAVREFWRLVGARRFAAARARLAPRSPLAVPATVWAIDRARLLRTYAGRLSAAPPAYATVEFPVDVYVKPTSVPNSWGPPGRHRIWMTLVRMSDESWRVYELGSGP